MDPTRTNIIHWNGKTGRCRNKFRGQCISLWAALQDLLQVSADETKKRIPVECILNMSGKIIKSYHRV